ncbi:SDR family NAD(P)-dependent oxidoreductase [Glycocaulis alkaliphilus]|nr:SDR family NAD(P)-dependent oxidoreductase [Glycocaulis alkaliphilus]
MRMLFLGFGYVANATARRLAATARMTATTRDGGKAEGLRAQGITPLLTGTGPGVIEEAVREASHVLVSAPPGEAGDPFLPLLDARMLKSRWVGYLSTTGVYGDRRGGWAFEWDRLDPVEPRSVWRAEAEAGWQAAGARIFRLAGIYGPGYSTFDKLREGRARRIIKPGQVFSRIHVDDIVEALLLAMARPEADGVFNLADDCPCPQPTVVEEAARLLGVEPPMEEAFDKGAMSPMQASFYSANRRVSNARAKQVLGWRPAFPSYREGLAAIYAAEKASTAPAP